MKDERTRQWLPGRPLTRLRDPLRRPGKGVCKIRGHVEGHFCLCGGHTALETVTSHGGGWSRLGGLAHSSRQLSLPCTPPPKLSLEGGRKREFRREIQGLRAMPPPIFIAGELEICFPSCLREVDSERVPREGSGISCANPYCWPCQAFPWADVGSGSGESTVTLSSALFFNRNLIQSSPPSPQNKGQWS